MPQVTKMNRAEQDLIEIWQQCCILRGELFADQYLDHFQQALRIISEFPEMHPLRSDLDRLVRSKKVGRHIIFYQFENDTISVVRVLHESMDIVSIIDEN